MIKGVGIDIIEVERVAQKVEQEDQHFKNMIFTKNEQSYCDRSEGVPAEHYAGKYAAKEAFFKAIGTGWRGKIKWTDVEILNDQLGKPEIALHNAAKEWMEGQCQSNSNQGNIIVSISHLKSMATAVVIIEIETS